MLRSAALVCSLLLLSVNLAGCGEAPMGASEGASSAPADAPASAPPGPDFSDEFNLVGTEPFWSGKIRGQGLTLSRAGQPDVTAANPGVKVKGEVGVWEAGDLVLRLKAEPCSDGMSDRRYPWAARVTLAGEVFNGCTLRPNASATTTAP